jgi:hypothetical protein
MKTERCSVGILLCVAIWMTACLPGRAALITSLVESGGDGAPFAQFTGNNFTGPTIGNYTVPTFQVLAKAFADRLHAWTNASGTTPFPPYLAGREYIMIRNDNRDNNGGVNGGSAGLYRLVVTIAEDANVYLLIDTRLGDGNNANPPTFSATNMQWVVDEGWAPVTNGYNRSVSLGIPDEVGIDGDANGGIADFASVFMKRFPAGSFTLKEANNASRNMYGVVIAPAPALTPVVTFISPATNAAPFHAAGDNFVFQLTSRTPMDTNAIRVLLNGTDVTSQAIVSGEDTNATVVFDALAANTFYSGTIEVTNSVGATLFQFTFDTFVAAETLVIDAEDYNYGDGDCSQPGNPLPPTQGGFYYDVPAPGTYSGLTAHPEIDYHDTSTNVNSPITNVFRLCDAVGTRLSGDVLHPPFAIGGFPDHDLWQMQAGEWLNYTRTIVAGTYAVYLRVASTAPAVIRLDKVFGDVTLTMNQPTSPAGTFIVPDTDAAYRLIPLTDALGSNTVVNFTSGGAETIRLSIISDNNAVRANYLVFVPVAIALSPTVASVSPPFNAVEVRPNAVISASIVNGTTAVDAGSILLKVDGVDVTSAMVLTNLAEGISIYYDPPGDLETNSTHSVYLQFSDDGDPAESFTNEWTFRTVSGAPFITMAQQGTANHWGQQIWSNPPSASVSSPVPGYAHAAVAGGNPTRIRNPAEASGDPVIGVKTFPGDSLRLDANTEIRAKGVGNTLNFPGVDGGPGLIFNGGNIDAGDDTMFPVTGVIQVLAPSTITCGDGVQAVRGWQFLAEVRGHASLQVTKQVTSTVPAVDVLSSNNTFSGDWIVLSGLLKGTGSNSLGTGNIVITATNTLAAMAMFEVMYNLDSPGTLTLANGGHMILHQDVRFAGVVIEGAELEPGLHAYADLAAAYPNNFAANGSGSIFVTGPPQPGIVLSDVSRSGANLTFSFTAAAGISYTVEYKENIDDAEWITLETVSGDGSVVTITDSLTASPTRFYRVSTP